MRVRMKLVVPLTMPSMRCTLVTIIDSRSTLTTGIAAHTLASHRSRTRCPAEPTVPYPSNPMRIGVDGGTTRHHTETSCGGIAPVGGTRYAKRMKLLIVGCGRVGSSIARNMADDGHDVSVIDEDAEALQ